MHAMLGKDYRWEACLHGDAQQLEEALLRRPEELEYIPALPSQLHCLTQRIPQILLQTILVSFAAKRPRYSVCQLSQAGELTNAAHAGGMLRTVD